VATAERWRGPITLVESTRADHREEAQQLLLVLMHVGITGVTGVGKSTSIEALGMHLIEQGHRVAALAGSVFDADRRVDPGRQDPDVAAGGTHRHGKHTIEANKAARERSGAIRLIYPHDGSGALRC
jgi:serine kinase of HPr protein (carbohydrate metabolism regulator)